MFKQPFALFSSATAGISTSSVAKIGDIQASEALGSAKVKTFVNAANGSLVIQDHQQRVDFPGFSLSLGYVINSGEPRFNQCKTLRVSDGTLNSAGSVITVTNGDGAEIEFAYDSAKGQYINTGLPGGQQSIKVLSGGGYQLTHYATGEVETYDSAGYLTQREDSHGNVLNYSYRAGKLVSIQSKNNGAIIELDDTQANTMAVTYQEQGERTPLATYHFNDKGALTQTLIPVSKTEQYAVTYAYASDGKTLESISESDTTAIHFDYEAGKVNEVKDGTGHVYALSYDGDTTTLTTPNDYSMSVTLDDKADITTVTKDSDSTQDETTHYAYDDSGRLKTKTLQSGAEFHWGWTTEGILNQYINGADATQNNIVDATSGLVTCRVVEAADGTAMPTWQVFDAERNLRFCVNAKVV